ncbi:hypothetical protein [Chitinophaga qingshengii]|uniref:DUF3106 domain-containing protein n=1 Tax=Chitinophaga qingshengii TaxID=1569794 RepID=A0ABR7TJP7_9BACT|nr:hypothetical protein [Chitinophaga qingshengii]MBC9930722.1 hypothetical protein [Chitinophaga qingshengii]
MRPIKKIGLAFLGIAFFAAVILLTQVLWNNLIPELFHGPVISYWQALGLLVLGKLLFGWHGRGGAPWGDGWRRRKAWKEKMKEKMAHMTPEQREAMKQRFRDYCDPRRFGCQDEEFDRWKDTPEDKPRNQDL